ncbi:MAG: galactokinase [Flavobacteriales bacterium]|nr:galactokinase [Flavobacteriales bacterium]
MNLWEYAIDGLKKNTSQPVDSIRLFFSPGRVNVLGEHIDYNGGWVMPCAIDKGIYAAVQLNNESVIRIISQSHTEPCIIPLNKEIRATDFFGWQRYPAGVAFQINRIESVKQGFDAYLVSNLPEGSGLSSSASLEALIGKIILQTSAITTISDRQLAMLCKHAENDFVGVQCGIMDQYAVIFGKKNALLMLDCENIVHEWVPFDSSPYRLLVIDTQKPRTLAGSAYNERKMQCDKALEQLQRVRSIQNLCEAELTDLQHLDDYTLIKRARHVITENKRVLFARNSLLEGKFIHLGELMYQSHASLRNDYEVSCKELDAIVDFTRHHEAGLGARMTGAGFGGCAIALVHEKGLELYKEQLQKFYFYLIGSACLIYEVQPSKGVHEFLPA